MSNIFLRSSSYIIMVLIFMVNELLKLDMWTNMCTNMLCCGHVENNSELIVHVHVQFMLCVCVEGIV